VVISAQGDVGYGDGLGEGQRPVVDDPIDHPLALAKECLPASTPMEATLPRMPTSIPKKLKT
jgi:hypothetical protein